MIEHTMRNFDADLQERASKIAEMGRLDDEQIALATDALVKGDDALAGRVNIAETVVYMVQRQPLAEERPKADLASKVVLPLSA